MQYVYTCIRDAVRGQKEEDPWLKEEVPQALSSCNVTGPSFSTGAMGAALTGS